MGQLLKSQTSTSNLRPHLSTQCTVADLARYPKLEPYVMSNCTILGLDASKGFDNRSLTSILYNLAYMNEGTCTDLLITNFLEDHTAKVHIANIKSEQF